ncbi:MAG: gamma-glutamyl-gamma-aminobutyrate hydrolase family protein [Planctomycetes bacterium]|nr:gamma-glutamyl-gamma-aminobutyrate hydrolase family protein [Planctomycetota bacterium]
MKPVIGINGDVKCDPELAVRLKCNYIDAVRRAGGVPIVLPAGSPEDVPYLLDRVDAVILTGGGDIDVRSLGIDLHPTVELMNPRRQQFDWTLTQAVLERPMPALGICLGMQMMAVVAGGKLHQHLPEAGIKKGLNHRENHDVELSVNSRLHSILGRKKINVVSHHHQGIAAPPELFSACAYAPDGVLEAFEATGDRFVVGVQWHPERDPDSEQTLAIFRALVDAARKSK